MLADDIVRNEVFSDERKLDRPLFEVHHEHVPLGLEGEYLS